MPASWQPYSGLTSPEQRAEVPTDAELPYPQLDLKAIAQSVGTPTGTTCGDSHFQGGGGDTVRHGDMNSILK